jgi:prepilin peptidase CpaA
MTMAFPYVAALVVALLGCVTDLRTRKLPNVLTFGAAAGAFGFHLANGGFAGLGWSAAGWLVGTALFFPLFALRGLGAGDVKMLAALGAWLGPAQAVWLAAFSAIAGGVFALGIAIAHGYTKQAFTNVWGLLGYWKVMGMRPHPGMSLEASGTPKVPYALPIAAGLVVTLWLK